MCPVVRSDIVVRHSDALDKGVKENKMIRVSIV